MSSYECSEAGGQKAGTCAHGFGFCCHFIFKPDSTAIAIKKKVSYIQNLNFPVTDFAFVDQTISLVPLNENICQLRLDFLQFDLGGSALKKPCDTQRFRIKNSQGEQMPFRDLCGRNRGQHLYLPVEDLELAATIEITTMGTQKQDYGYRWNIKVTQVNKNDNKCKHNLHLSSWTVPTQKKGR